MPELKLGPTYRTMARLKSGPTAGLRPSRSADASQRALRVGLLHPEPAVPHHADVTDREVESHGIGRIERPQRSGDVGRPSASRTSIARQLQALAQPNDVRIERHDQPVRRDARPDAEIDFIATDHPAQIQVQPLARAAARRTREEVGDAGARPHSSRNTASDRAPARASRTTRARRRRPARCRSSPSAKNPSIDPERVEHLPQHIEQRDDVPIARPAMDEAVEERGMATRIELADERRRRRPHPSRAPHEPRPSRRRRCRRPGRQQ